MITVKELIDVLSKLPENIIVHLDVADECDNIAEGKLTAITANINGVGNIQSVTLSSHTLVHDNRYSKILLNKGLV